MDNCHNLIRETAFELAEENDLKLLSLSFFRSDERSPFQFEAKFRMIRPASNAGREMGLITIDDQIIAQADFTIREYVFFFKNEESIRPRLEEEILEIVDYYTNR